MDAGRKVEVEGAISPFDSHGWIEKRESGRQPPHLKLPYVFLNLSFL
jgi:hypothetical protein